MNDGPKPAAVASAGQCPSAEMLGRDRPGKTRQERAMANLRGAIVPVTPFQQNCAILWDDQTKRALVVDPGGDVDRILAAIDQAGVTVERILLTHGHLDHAGGAAGLAEALRERPGAGSVPIEGPDSRDAFLLQRIARQAAKHGFEARDVTPDRWLEEGNSVVLGPHRFDVLH